MDVTMIDTSDCDQESADFLEHACLSYNVTDDPTRVQQARNMLLASPDLAERNIWTTACVGAVDVLMRFLNADAQCVESKGGPFNWEPLLYAAYSRLNAPDYSTLDVAKRLLQRGANPNAHFMWAGQYRFTALTGAFGEGERGMRCQPPHQDCEALARLLLEAGANPNDSQALYNTMFTPGDRCLELLLEYGLDADAKCNWLLGCSASGLRPNTQGTLHYQLMWAIRKGHSSRAKLLIKHGADASLLDDQCSPWKAAMLAGHTGMIDDLLENGASAEPLDAVEEFAAAAMSENCSLAKHLLNSDP